MPQAPGGSRDEVKSFDDNSSSESNASERVICEFTGRTLLHEAVIADDCAAVEALLRSGMDVNTPDRDRQTALHYAARGGSDSMISLLLGLGSDITKIDCNGHTPLRLAALHENWHTIQAFEAHFSKRPFRLTVGSHPSPYTPSRSR